MKRQFAIGALLALFLSLSSFASAQITMIARLSGAQETPPTTSTGTGLAVLTLDASKTHLTYDLAVSGLTDITASHIHRGAVGVAGPVIIPITAGPFSYASATIDVTPDEVNDLLSGNMYVNVHTAANPGGEIRGQVLIPSGDTFIALVSGANENPPVTTDAKGIGLFTLDQTHENITWEVVLTGLVDMTASHIHQAAAGVNGPVIIPISAGPYTYNTGTSPITADQLAALQAGGLYFNAHTTANPGGEIRGQLLAPLHEADLTTESTWQFPIVLTTNVPDASVGSGINAIGTAPGASDGWAANEDTQGPIRAPFNFASISIIHTANEPGWENHGGLYIDDIRAPIDPGQSKTWGNLFVSSDLAGTADAPDTITLTWPSLGDISSNLKFTLVDKNDVNGDGITAYDMRGINSFTFTNNASPDNPTQNTEFAITVSNTRALPHPVISNLTASTITSTSITLTWTTDVASDSNVRYGTSADNLDKTVSSTDPTLTTQHSVAVTGLTPGTQYFFEASSTAPGITPGTATIDATTLKVISAAAPISTTDISDTGATVTIQTDIPTTAKVSFGTDQNNLDQSIDLTNPQTTQAASLTGLQKGTQYFVRAVSSSPGAEDLVQTTTFTTLGEFKANDLVVENLTGTTATVTVTSTQPSTATLTFGTPDLATNPQTMTDTVLGTTHIFQLTGLQLNATYQAQATVSATGLPDAKSNVATFTTLQTVVLTGPTVTVTPNTATFAFTTDISSTGEIRYGTTQALGSVMAFAAATDHTVNITGLQPGTTYFYQLFVQGSGRDPLTTAVAQFTTEAAPPVIVKGDLDGDGKVTIQDVVLTLQQVIGITNLTDAQIAAADVVPQGAGEPPLDLRDVTRLLRASSGIQPL